MGRIWGFGVFLLFGSGFSWGNACPTLLTASFGFSGPVILQVEPSEVIALQDGYSLKPPHRIPEFRKVRQLSSLRTFDRWVSASALPTVASSLPFLAGVSASGESILFLPDGRSFEIALPGLQKPVATALYRASLRGIESKSIPLRTVNDSTVLLSRKAARTATKALEDAEVNQPISVLSLTQNYLYRSTLNRVNVRSLSQEARKMLLAGTVRFEIDPEERFHSPSLIELPLLDFSGSALNHFYLIPTADPDVAYEFTPPTKFVMLSRAKLAGAAAFLSVISDSTVVIGTTTGTAYLLDTETKEVTRTIGLPRPDGFRSLSARYVGGKIEVWAVSLNKGELFRWTTDDLTFLFSHVKIPTYPDQVATFASPVPVSYSPLKNARERGFFANIDMGPKGAEIEEVLVLDREGDLYGLRPPEGLFLGQDQDERTWEHQPFEETPSEDEDGLPDEDEFL